MIYVSHAKREHRERSGVAAPLIHLRDRSLRRALENLMPRKTLGSHRAAGLLGPETRTDGFEKFRLLWDSKTEPSSQKFVLVAHFIICSKVKTTLLSVY